MDGRESYVSLDRELKDASSEISEIILTIFDGVKIKFSSSTHLLHYVHTYGRSFHQCLHDSPPVLVVF